MPTEDSKALSRRFLEELWNQRNLAIVDELLAADYVDHTLGVQPGSEGLKQTVSEYLQDFSDIHATIEDQIVEGDMVVTRVTWNCQLTSGEQVTVTGIGIDRIADGKIIEGWNQSDVPRRVHQHVFTRRNPPKCTTNQDCPPGTFCMNGVCVII
jgi:predicted SnoaL-like aldol condensation-catalyzing enzyme